jgi:hypothetical protein
MWYVYVQDNTIGSGAGGAVHRSAGRDRSRARPGDAAP